MAQVPLTIKLEMGEELNTALNQLSAEMKTTAEAFKDWAIASDHGFLTPEEFREQFFTQPFQRKAQDWSLISNASHPALNKPLIWGGNTQEGHWYANSQRFDPKSYLVLGDTGDLRGRNDVLVICVGRYRTHDQYNMIMATLDQNFRHRGWEIMYSHW